MSTTSVHEKAFAELQAKVEFYEEILDKIPALVYINEVDERELKYLQYVWMNKRAMDFLGHTQGRDNTNGGKLAG